MTEVCINGHTRTEENTRWHKRGRGEQRKRVCLDCKREKRVNPSQHRQSSVADRHEDVADLLRFGATFNEIVERSGYTCWETLSRSLRAAGKLELLEAVRLKRSVLGVTEAVPRPKRKPVCVVRECGKKRYAKQRCKPHYMQKLNGVKQPNRTHCKVTDCGNKHRCKGYCNKHYLQSRKGKLENIRD